MPGSFDSKAISLFGWNWRHFPVPANVRNGATRSGGPGRRKAPAPWRLALDGREACAKLPFCGRRASWVVAVGIVFAGGRADLAHAQAPPHRSSVTLNPPVASRPEFQTIEAAITEASLRFGLPPAWIRAIIQAESGSEPRAISRAGAMGLMQLMPPTWAEWRARMELGGDPFDVRDNVMAGSAYLRALFDRFGVPGFVAAYNAGPARYAEHLARARPLPTETQAYLLALVPKIADESPPPIASPARDWRRGGLFVGRVEVRPAAPSDALFVRTSAPGARL